MSAQPQQLQQTPVVYPTTATRAPQDTSSSSHSDGSFGTVFIVLAVILVVSALACILGRICSRKSNKQPQKQPKAPPKQSHKTLPKEREPRELRDVEFGFDRKRVPKVKPHDDDQGGDIELGFDRKRIPSVKHGVKFKLPENGRQPRQGGRDMEFKAGS